MKIHAMVLAGIWGMAAVCSAETLPLFSMSLLQAEAQAQSQSARAEAKNFEIQSATASVDGQFSQFWPKLSLEGSYTYLDKISSINMSLGPGRTLNLEMGNHTNYSVGLQAAWNVWDALLVYNSWKALQAVQNSKNEEMRWLRRELALKTRLAYFQTQLALEKLQMTKSSADLARDQYRDIEAKARAGVASRKDAISSHLEVLSRSRQLRVAQADLAMALRDLLAIADRTNSLDVSRPWYAGEKNLSVVQAQAATVAVVLDDLNQSLVRLEKNGAQPVDPEHPQAQFFLNMAQSAQASAESLASGHWPKAQVIAKASLDYPNGTVAEQVQQNTLAVKGSWPLWEANRVVNQTREKEAQAQAQLALAENAKTELAVSWAKAQDRLAQLNWEQPLIDKMVAETKDLARVAYAAYAAGRADYIEVQAANLQALDASTQAALNKVQRLIQLATLDSLSSEKE